MHRGPRVLRATRRKRCQEIRLAYAESKRIRRAEIHGCSEN